MDGGKAHNTPLQLTVNASVRGGVILVSDLATEVAYAPSAPRSAILIELSLLYTNKDIV